MSEISRSALFAKLDPLLFASLERATAFCRLRGNPYVELAHWLHQLWQGPQGDLQHVLRHFEASPERLQRDLIEALDRLPRGAGSISDLSAHIDEAVERAWVYGSLKYGAAQIRGFHLLLGMLRTPWLRHVLFGISREFERILPDVLAGQFAVVVSDSCEAQAVEAAPPPVSTTVGGRALQQYAIDLTARARADDIDPVTGRDDEIRQIINVLLRRRQNNPLLAGEAGVGKTAVVEGLAVRIAAGDVPPPLREVALYLLDVGLLQAGAVVKGEFERRLRQVVDEVQASERPIVLFIDEIHTLIGAGGVAGTGDAANLLKPMLARGELRTIGATTWAEYKKYIEKDPALTRRFQVLQIHEPDEARAITMVRGLANKLALHHDVLLLDEAIRAAVTLSHRYLPVRQLPDKAVSLLDTACARVAVSQHALPTVLEGCQRRIEALRVEQATVARECLAVAGEPARLDALAAQLVEEEATHAMLHTRWQAEQAVAAQVIGLRRQLLGNAHLADRQATVADLKRLLAELADRQLEQPLVLPVVDAHTIASVVADWTGIPVGRMVKDEAQAILGLADTLSMRVIGQRHGLEAIARRVQTSRARLDDPGKPVGVFLLTGPSGVGKTETALALAETLYGGEQNLISINMSEFQEAHTVSTLKGAPPGYIGYGEGGVLTEAVRRRPYSVVLLDEIEKAHPDVHEMFYQVFDKGWMEDGEGRYIDFRNTIIVLTSNVGSERMLQLCQDRAPLSTPEVLAQALREPLRRVFPAALLGRLTVIPYYPLSDEMLANIVSLQLARIARRIGDNHCIDFQYTPAVVQLVCSRCAEVESGGRMIDAVLTHTVLPRISREILLRASSGQPLQRISLDASAGNFSYCFEQVAADTAPRHPHPVDAAYTTRTGPCLTVPESSS